MTFLKDCLIATRPWSFPMSCISVTVGTILGWQEGPIRWSWFVLSLIGVVFFHAAANILNDYFDTRYQVDQPDSPTTLYRAHPLVANILTPNQLLAEGVIFLSLTGIIGLVLVLERSMILMGIGLAGAVACVFYTAGPINFKYRAMGEVAVFFVWGPLMISGAYVVQRQAISLDALCVSVPLGLWVALVLLANNMRDIAYDARRNIKTVSILLGPDRSYILFAGLMLSAYLFTTGIVVAGVLSPWALLVYITLPSAVRLLRSFRTRMPDMADALTARVETVFGLVFIVALLLDRAVSL